MTSVLEMKLEALALLQPHLLLILVNSLSSQALHSLFSDCRRSGILMVEKNTIAC